MNAVRYPLLAVAISLFTAVQTASAAILYQMSFNGAVTQIANSATSGNPLPFLALVGPQQGVAFQIAPGDNVQIDAAGMILGNFAPLVTPSLFKPVETTRITALEDGVTWNDTTAGTTGNLDLSEQKDFPRDHHITTTGKVRRGRDYEDTLTSATTASWNLSGPALHPFFNTPLFAGMEFGQLHIGSLESVNDDRLGVVYTAHAAVGTVTGVVPEPMSVTAWLLGGAALLRLRRLGRRSISETAAV